jgi:hypothetical protein
MIKKAIQALAGMVGVKVLRSRNAYQEDGLFTYHSDGFRSRAEFRAAYKRGLMAAFSDKGDPRAAGLAGWNGAYVPGVFGQWRTHIALWCASTAARLEGDFVECGVFVGFLSSAIMKNLDWDRRGKTFYLVDTFAGPDTEQYTSGELARGRKAETEHLRKIGGYKYSLESVQKNFQEWRNVRFLKGLVPDSLKDCAAEKVAYLHLDMNAVVPEVEALRFFWDKLVPGGIVLMDDYAYAGYEEQHKGLDALADELGFSIASLPTGQGLIIKTPR